MTRYIQPEKLWPSVRSTATKPQGINQFATSPGAPTAEKLGYRCGSLRRMSRDERQITADGLAKSFYGPANFQKQIAGNSVHAHRMARRPQADALPLWPNDPADEEYQISDGIPPCVAQAESIRSRDLTRSTDSIRKQNPGY